MRTTLIIPCYNEAKRLDVATLRTFVAEGATHVLFVDDGSTDETLAALQPLVAEGAEVLSLERNGGKAEAVRRGVLHAALKGSKYVGFWDADLATPLPELAKFVALLEADDSLEVITGARVKLLGRHIVRRPSRHYVGRVGATLISHVLGMPTYDTQCGAKLFRNNHRLQRVFATPFLSRWIFDVEIIARYQAEFVREGRNFRDALYELPLSTWIDVEGSKVRAKDFARAVVDLWRIHQRYTPRKQGVLPQKK